MSEQFTMKVLGDFKLLPQNSSQTSWELIVPWPIAVLGQISSKNKFA